MLGWFPGTDGKWPKFFDPIPVMLLKEIRGDRNKKYKVGTQMTIQRMPSDQIYIMDGEVLCIKSGAVEGVDFQYLQKPQTTV